MRPRTASAMLPRGSASRGWRSTEEARGCSLVAERVSKMANAQRAIVLAVVSLFLSLAFSVPTPASADHAFCLDQKTTIDGTDRNDIIDGTPGDDVIFGGGGEDTINGLGGDDRICGGNGNAPINGGP